MELSTISRYAEAAGNNTPFCEHNSFKMDSQKSILPSYINEAVNVFAELTVYYSQAGVRVFVLQRALQVRCTQNPNLNSVYGHTHFILNYLRQRKSV